MHLGMEKSTDLIASLTKIDVKTIPTGIFVFALHVCLLRGKCQTFAFRIHKMSNTNENIFKKKQSELLHDTLGSVAAGMEAMKGNFLEVYYAQIQLSHIGVSSFSSLYG